METMEPKKLRTSPVGHSIRKRLRSSRCAGALIDQWAKSPGTGPSDEACPACTIHKTALSWCGACR